MDTSQLPGRGIKPWLSLRKHYRLSMLIWLLVVIAGIPIVWLKGQSFYTAEAVFQVSPSYMKNLSVDKELEFQSNSQYREFVNHLSVTVVRYDVIQRALKKLADEKITVNNTNLPERKFIERLQKTVYVRAIPDTYMVRIGMDGQTKDTLDDLVNGITNSFLETTKNEQIFGTGERLDVLQSNKVKLGDEIVQLEAQRVPLAEQLGLTTFTDNIANPYDTILAQAREKLTIASIERAQAEAMLNAFLAQRETPAAMGRSILEMRLQDNGLQALRNEVVKRSEEIGRVTAGLEDKHPAKKPALQEFEAINQRLTAKESDFEKVAFENVKNRLTASLRQTKQVESEVQSTLKKIEGQAATFARTFQQAMHITSDIRKREQELKDVRDRLNYLQTERGAIGFVRLVTPALPAETPQGIGKTKLMLFVLIAAFGLALIAPVVVDMLDRRIYTVNDAEKLFGIPAAGWQVEVEDMPTEMYAREQTRRFASTLMRDKGRSGQNVFGFSSVKSVGGSSQIILDTAVVLKQLGTRVLVVDANSFSPSTTLNAHTFGLSNFLLGEAALGQIEQSVNHQNEDITAIGFGTGLPEGMQRLDLFKQAIAQWSDDFDFVLVDLPPMLVSADAEMLIDSLGQVFLVLEAQAVSRGEVSRAKRLLEKLNPQAVGLFVNRVPAFDGGGYLQELMVENFTRNKFSNFMNSSSFKLNLQILRAQWLQKRMKKR